MFVIPASHGKYIYKIDRDVNNFLELLYEFAQEIRLKQMNGHYMLRSEIMDESEGYENLGKIVKEEDENILLFYEGI